MLKFRLYPFFIMKIKEFTIPNMRHHLGSSAENYVYGQFPFSYSLPRLFNNWDRRDLARWQTNLISVFIMEFL